MNFSLKRESLTGLFLKEIGTKKTDKLFLKLTLVEDLFSSDIEELLGTVFVRIILVPYNIDVYKELIQCLNLRIKKSVLEENKVSYCFENDMGMSLFSKDLSSGPIGVFES
jgi:hypothetical protein